MFYIVDGSLAVSKWKKVDKLSNWLTMNFPSPLLMSSKSANSSSGISCLYFSIISFILWFWKKILLLNWNLSWTFMYYYCYLWYWTYCFLHSGVIWAPRTFANFIAKYFLGFKQNICCALKWCWPTGWQLVSDQWWAPVNVPSKPLSATLIR